MPSRKLPRTVADRYIAVNTAKQLKDAVPPPTVIPFTGGTITRMDAFLPAYKAKMDARDAALQAQVDIGAQMPTVRIQAEYLIYDFYNALQRAIRRKVFNASVRTLYGLAANDATVPTLNSESDVSLWGERAATGEAARIAAGGAPITFPSIAEADTDVNAFNGLNLQQTNAKMAYDAAQEAVEAENPEADKLILKMWNEVETAFDEGDKPSMRRKAREWGVIYVPTPGQPPSPEDFSIMGKLTDAATAAPLADVQLTVMETGATATTDANGDYFMGLQPDGLYTLQAVLAGFQDAVQGSIQVTAGSIATVDMQMSAAPATGTVSGNVQQAGVNVKGATIAVEGFPLLTATTDVNGDFILTDVPEGAQQITAQLPPPAADPPQTLTATVVAGGEVKVNFGF